MAEKNAKEMVKTAVAALQDKKGEDIRVIDISGVTVIADYFIIASGSTRVQKAIIPRHGCFQITMMSLCMYFHRTTVCFMIWSVSGVTEKKLMWIHYKMFQTV